MVRKNRANYTDARNTCKSLKGTYDLVSIVSAVEHKFVAYTLDSIKGSAWIGLDSLTSKGNFTWSDGLPIGFGSKLNQYPDGRTIH